MMLIQQNPLAHKLAKENEKQCGTNKGKCLKLIIKNINLWSFFYPLNKNAFL